jgi:hypothetical protein
MGQLLDQISRHVDMVVIDTPPSMVADAQILSARVDAVLFVIQPGVTRANMARAALESFRRSGARVIGVVMNRIPRNREYYYGGYKYYSAYGGNKHYYASAEPKPAAEQTVKTSSLQSLPKAVLNAEQKPAHIPAGGYVPPSELPIHKPIQLKLEQPGSNGSFPPEELEEDEHPSVEKLFADLPEPPPQNPSNHRKNGHG